MKLFERAMRRASIPIAMSKGFNPHPKMSVPLSLSVGISGKNEILELDLLPPLSIETLLTCFKKQLPNGIQILSAEVIPQSLKGSVYNATYEVVFKDAHRLKTVKIHEFLNRSSVIVYRTKNRNQKPFNVRPSVQEIVVRRNVLKMTIKMLPDGMAKPDEVLLALGMEKKKELFEIIRTKVNLNSSA
ncbi:MAG: TIGR03936 family radical SAM-associated protein [Candidatus Brocadiaceae bacterium]|nr:TIGR03936 family radical SAM-associated protein [Candidatus Brocadiaceae bacterium]